MTGASTAPATGRRWTWRDWAVTAGAAEAIALGVWLLPASVRIVAWTAAGPTRLALFAPTTQLVGLAVAALAAVVAAGVMARRSGGSTASLERLPSVVAPLNWLWVWAVPYLPWLPDRAPLVLVLGGPLRWVVAGAVAWSVLLRTGVSARWLVGVVTRHTPGRRTVFALSLAFHLASGLHSVGTLGVGGDEPHYLVITQSLVRDRDLAIENNHERGDYREYYGGPLRPDYMRRGIDGHIYSVHAPGLPTLLIPSFLLGGARGAVAFMALLGALAALAIFDVALALTSRPVAWVVWAAVCLAVPFVPHAWLIFPEMAGALIVAWAVGWLVGRGNTGVWRWVVRGAALSVLPWLHTKFVVFQALLGLAVAARAAGVPFAPGAESSRRDASSAAAFLLPNLASGLLWLYSFHALYGVFNPEAAYGAYVEAYVRVSNIPHSLVGLFFDQKFGLLFYAPAYAAAVGGALAMARTPDLRRLGLVLGLVVAVFLASTARLYMFWGGSSAPARFLVPILPCLVPMLALACARFRGAAFRGGMALAIGTSLVFAVVASARPEARLFYSDPHGRARVLQMLDGGAPLAEAIPTFTDADWAEQVDDLIPWLIAAGCGCMAAIVAGRRGASARSAGTACVVVGGVVAVLLVPVPRLADVRVAVAGRGALSALWEFDGARHRALDYSRIGRPAPERLQDLRTLRMGGRVTDGQFRSDPVNIPQGTYDVVVWFKGARPREGRIRVLELPDSTMARVDGALGNPTRLRVQLPVRARAMSVRVEGVGAVPDPSEIQVVPLDVKAPRDRPSFPVRTFEPIPGPPHAYVIYTDAHVYPEGGVFWTRGTADTRVYIAPAGARRLRLTLSTGPRDGEVRVESPVLSRREMTRANEASELVVDLPAGQALIPLDIGASVAFRPGDVDPASSDMRTLGCRVLMALE